MRTRRKDKELGPPLRFGDASEKDRIVGATLTNQMLQTSAPPALLFFPLRFCPSLPKKVHGSDKRFCVGLRRQGQYDHSLHATKCSAPHSPRQGANTAPRYRDYQPSKWMGQPMVLNSTGTMGSHTQFLGDNRTVRSPPSSSSSFSFLISHLELLFLVLLLPALLLLFLIVI